MTIEEILALSKQESIEMGDKYTGKVYRNQGEGMQLNVRYSSFLNCFFTKVLVWDTPNKDRIANSDVSHIHELEKQYGLDPNNWELHPLYMSYEERLDQARAILDAREVTR